MEYYFPVIEGQFGYFKFFEIYQIYDQSGDAFFVVQSVDDSQKTLYMGVH
jgi:hypothetical protein